MATADELATLAHSLSLATDEIDLRTLTEVAAELLQDCERLDELAAAEAHASSELAFCAGRDGHRPAPEENPVYGWVWRCEVRAGGGGILAGRTVALKDNISLAGAPLLNGSQLMTGFTPTRDAAVVTRLLRAGATIIGKTAVPAFCCEGAGLFGYPEPLPVNPFDSAFLPGGSSSGSAAVIANGEVDIALGGDQGGSIRIPAAWCGCCGLKPSFGLVPYTGIVPVELSLDVVGPMARNVADCAKALAAIAGPDGADQRQRDVIVQDYPAALERLDEPIRFGLLREGFGIPGASEPEVDEQVWRIAARLGERCNLTTEVSIPMHRDGVALWNGISLQGITALAREDGTGTNWRGEHWPELARHLRVVYGSRANELPPTLRATLLAGEYVGRTRGTSFYATAQNLARTLAGRYDAMFADIDVLVMPTVPMRAVRRPAEMSSEERLRLAIGLDMSANTAPFNVTGHPAMSVPCQPAGELPIGMHVVGRRFDDATVLRAAAAIERERESLGRL